VVLAIGAIVLLATASVFEESTFGVERFLYGADTRTRVWLFALDEFARYPLFGAIPAIGEEGQNLVESTYLRSLALMGIVGGAFVFMVVASMTWSAFRAWRASRRCPWLAPQADVVVSSTAYMVIVNAAEGLMLGVLTIFVVFLYAIFATTAFILDAAMQSDNPGSGSAQWDDSESEPY
jgi:O-antigen ligase